ETERSTNRSQAVGSAIDAGHDEPEVSGTSMAAGSRNGASNAIATSRATPRMESAYPRSGVTSSSSTSSRRPSSSTTSAPIGESGGRSMIPGDFSAMPSSASEQIMPSEIRPYTFRELISNPPG